MMTFSDADRGVTAANGTTKARLERAALTQFAERGVDAVTTRAIVAAAGVAEGSLYRHFRGKEALAEALYFAIHEKLGRLVHEAGSAHRHINDQVRAIVVGYCQTADDDWSLFCYHLMMTHRFLPGSKSKRRDRKNPVAAAEAIITAAMKCGEIKKGDAALVAAMALGVVLQAALHKAYGRFQGKLAPKAPVPF